MTTTSFADPRPMDSSGPLTRSTLSGVGVEEAAGRDLGIDCALALGPWSSEAAEAGTSLTRSTIPVSCPKPISVSLPIVTSAMGRPATQEWLALARSRYVQAPSEEANSPCLRETDAWLATMSHPESRPTLQARPG